MKTEKSLTIFSLLAFFLNIVLSANTFASNEGVNMQPVNQARSSYLDHIAIAEQHRHLASKMQDKKEIQIEILKNKPSTSFLGRNGKYLKSRIVNKIQEYDQVARENLAKAAYHSAIAAEQASMNSSAQSGQMGNQLNKARIKSNGTSGL
ncbi:MAG: hypothetical protein IT528_05155 [Nitrosomonas sp.]|nr:hypothetical protein [Nitrosomonas sp.]